MRALEHINFMMGVRDTRWSIVIARESGRSSSHKIPRDYWMPRLRGA
jgi:hypothetical protein